MLDRQLFRTDLDAVKAGIARKHIDAPIDDVVRLDSERRALLAELEVKQAEMNRVSKEIGKLMGQGKREDAEAAKSQTKTLKDEITLGEQEAREIDAALRNAELLIPNIPHPTAPDGVDENDNVFVRDWGVQPKFAEQPKPHWEVCDALRLVDFARGSKIAASGFPVYTGWGARLQRGLIAFMIDTQTHKNGYSEV